MNKNGFTLVELLAVIILLFLIITFALPQITNSVNNNRDKTDEVMLEMIKTAAKLYVSDNESRFPKVNGSVYYLPLSELVEEDYLNENIQYNGVNIKNTKRVTVVYNNGFEYYVTNLKTCTLVEGNAKEIGSKYECEVKPGTIYNFYVLSYNDEDNNIIYDKSKAVTTNLIMDRNMCDDGTPTQEGKTCLVAWSSNDTGPIIAMNYLATATNTWINLKNMIISTFDDGSGTIHDMKKIYNTYARMPMYSEVCNCDETKVYLYVNLNSETKGYWTSSYFPSDSGDLSYAVSYGAYVTTDVGTVDIFGVRPVINLKL